MAIDFKSGEDGNMVIKDLDFVLDNCDEKHIYDVMASNAGDYPESPITGMNIISYINSPVNANSKQTFERGAKIQMEYDGLSKVAVKVKDWNNIQINGERV